MNPSANQPVLTSLEQFRPARRPPAAYRNGNRNNGDAEISEYTETGRRVRFRSRCAADTLLVASLVHYGGWEARDEAGRRLATTLANGPFLALTVPAGDHRISLRYTPPGWREGLLISLATALAALVAAARASARPASTAGPRTIRAREPATGG